MLPQTSSLSSQLPLALADKSPFHPLDLVRVSGPPRGRRRVVAAAQMSASRGGGGAPKPRRVLIYSFAHSLCRCSSSRGGHKRRCQRVLAADGSVPWTTWTDEHLEARPAEVATATPKPKLARPLKLLRVDAGSEASLQDPASRSVFFFIFPWQRSPPTPHPRTFAPTQLQETGPSFLP